MRCLKVNSLLTNFRWSIVKEKTLKVLGWDHCCILHYGSVCVCVCVWSLTEWDTATVAQLISSDHVHGCLISQSHTPALLFPCLFDISNPLFSPHPFFSPHLSSLQNSKCQLSSRIIRTNPKVLQILIKMNAKCRE